MDQDFKVFTLQKFFKVRVQLASFDGRAEAVEEGPIDKNCCILYKKNINEKT